MEHDRPERSLVLTELRGASKTVLLNALRSQVMRSKRGTGKFEARPDQSLCRPLGSTLHMAARELAHPDADAALSVTKAFIERTAKPETKISARRNPGINMPASRGHTDLHRSAKPTRTSQLLSPTDIKADRSHQRWQTIGSILRTIAALVI